MYIRLTTNFIDSKTVLGCSEEKPFLNLMEEMVLFLVSASQIVNKQSRLNSEKDCFVIKPLIH